VGEFANPGKIITRLMSFIFPLAGMALFAILVFAGFEIMMAAIDKKSLETGKQRATAAVIGFILLFLSYWMVKIIELVFGIVILG
ncbi:MAG TPA: hypothetical protein DEP87_01735, partial [Candidatus Pacebacteria bacterium]|nr:hypothetical protein [Candidatus Paceibacterota bacterium]